MICGQSLALGTPAISLSGSAPGVRPQAHYQETGHPLAVRLESGSPWRLCYTHQRPV
jgi:hypothetical protein